MGRQLWVDGKEHRATIPAGQHHALVRTLSVWVADAHLSFGQAQIGAKTNEKTAIAALPDALDVAGSIVTIDASACQPSVVGQGVASGADWPGLCTLVLVETERHTSPGVTRAQRFSLRSLTAPDPAVYVRLVRGHWAVENQLHWQLDLTFKEDQSRLRTGHAALNANILRKTALCLLAQNPQLTSLKRKRKQAAYDNDYLQRLLQNA